MRKLYSIILATMLAITLIFSTTSATPVQAATAKKAQTYTYNQTDFYNYMSYLALLFKQNEIAMAKYEKSFDKSEKEFLAAAKVIEKEIRATRTKLNKVKLKNKDFAKIQKLQVQGFGELAKAQSLVVQALETYDEDLLLELEDKVEVIEKKIDKLDKEYSKLMRAAIKKHKIKNNTSINYVLTGKNAKKVSDKTFTYIVKKDDKISQVAKTYGVKANDIKKLNKLKSSKLKVGQKIKIKVK